MNEEIRPTQQIIEQVKKAMEILQPNNFKSSAELHLLEERISQSSYHSEFISDIRKLNASREGDTDKIHGLSKLLMEDVIHEARRVTMQ